MNIRNSTSVTHLDLTVSRWLVPLLIASLPFTGSEFPLGALTVPVTDLLLLITAATLIVEILVNHRLVVTKSKVMVSSVLLLIIIVFLISTLSQARPVRPVITQLGRFLILAIVLLYVTTFRRGHRVLTASFVAAVVISSLTVVSTVFHLQIGTPFLQARQIGPYVLPFSRTLGVKLTYGIYGMYTLTATPYFLLLAIKRRDWLLSVGVTIVGSGIVIGQSRSTWIAMFVSVGVIGLYSIAMWANSGDRIRRRLAEFGTIFGSLLIVPLCILFARFLIRMDRSTVLSRLEQYYAALIAISENPLLGMGSSAFQTRFDLGYIPHNAFLRFGVDTGVIGFILVTAIFAYTTLLVGRYTIWSQGHHQRYAVGVLAGLLAVIVEAFFQPSLGRAAWVAVGLGVSSTVVCNRRKECR